MHVCVDKLDYCRILDQLLPVTPNKITIIEWMRVTIMGIWEREVWVDKWPQFSVILIKAKTAEINSRFNDRNVIVYVEEEAGESLQTCVDLLANSDVLNWSHNIIFSAIPDFVVPVILEAAASKDHPRPPIWQNYIMEVTRESSLEQNILLPKDLIEGRLKSEHASLVSSLWKYSDEGPHPVVYMRELIEHLPSVCLTTRDGGELVGWFMGQEYGAMGMLHVREEYRGRGLAKYLIASLVKRLLDAGLKPWIVVETDNEISQRLHTQCGFFKTSTTNWLHHYIK